MAMKRIPVTVVHGGYNYNYADRLITEEYPRFPNYYIEFTTEETDIRLYLDYPFDASDPSFKRAKISIAVMEEPYVIVPEFEHFVYNNHDKFDLIFTNHKGWEGMFPNVRYFPGAGASVKEWGLFQKTKDVCAIFSHKNYAEGHKLRQQIREDAFFHGFPGLDFVNSEPYVPDRYADKSSLIRPYRFSIEIEPVFDTLIGDKALDCFLTGTIPIYKGTPKIKKYFEPSGIIMFDTIPELKQILIALAQGYEFHYNVAFPAVRHNHHVAKVHTDFSAMLWSHGLYDLIKEKGML